MIDRLSSLPPAPFDSVNFWTTRALHVQFLLSRSQFLRQPVPPMRIECLGSEIDDFAPFQPPLPASVERCCRQLWPMEIVN